MIALLVRLAIPWHWTVRILSRQFVKASKSADDVAKAAENLKALPKASFSGKDWAARIHLLGDLDSQVIKLAVLAADSGSSAATATVPQRAHNIVSTLVASQDTGSREWQQFDSAFEAVTGQGIKDAACGTILDSFAPDSRPEEEKGSTDTDALIEWALQGFENSTPSYTRQTVTRYIDLYKWAKSVLDDGGQVASAV